jgi:hypothetical protein
MSLVSEVADERLCLVFFFAGRMIRRGMEVRFLGLISSRFINLCVVHKFLGTSSILNCMVEL